MTKSSKVRNATVPEFGVWDISKSFSTYNSSRLQQAAIADFHPFSNNYPSMQFAILSQSYFGV